MNYIAVMYTYVYLYMHRYRQMGLSENGVIPPYFRDLSSCSHENGYLGKCSIFRQTYCVYIYIHPILLFHKLVVFYELHSSYTYIKYVCIYIYIHTYIVLPQDQCLSFPQRSAVEVCWALIFTLYISISLIPSMAISGTQTGATVPYKAIFWAYIPLAP